jgi:hypothetical protein
MHRAVDLADIEAIAQRVIHCADAASGNGDGQMGLAGAGTANRNGVALLGDEATASEIIDQGLVDGRALELEVLKVLGKRQWVADRPSSKN